MSKMKMVFNEFIDRSVVNTFLAVPADLFIDIENNFNESATYQLNLRDLASPELNAFLSTLDEATFMFQENALIWNIDLSGKNFSLNMSYVRDAVSTGRPLTALPTGAALTVRFDVPGFSGNSFRELTLRYDSAFDPDELLLLEEIGIEVIGNGTSFSITNLIECKASFYKPDPVLEQYVINYNGVNTILI